MDDLKGLEEKLAKTKKRLAELKRKKEKIQKDKRDKRCQAIGNFVDKHYLQNNRAFSDDFVTLLSAVMSPLYEGKDHDEKSKE